MRQRFGKRIEPEGEPWLRWYPSEWELQCEAREHFHEVQEILDDFDIHSDDVSEEEAEAHISGLRETCARVLADLDAEGMFGNGAAREEVVVILMESDQSNDERIAWAKRLNPENVSKRFEAELVTAQSVWERKQQAGLL